MTITKPENEVELRRALERLIHRPGMLQADTDQQIRVLLRHVERRGLSLEQCLVAKVGTEDYSWLTVYACSRGTVELLDDVPRNMFHPEPEVDSKIVRLTPCAQSTFNFNNARLFVQMLKCVFSERNKKLSNAALPFAKNVLRLSTEDTKSRLKKLPFCEERVRTLSPETFGEVAHVLID
jgi:16S rRNA A1518/A1519 N6-dimethyltransferase RsmA/KsgA/DIM1 with predicted DNA glycosylase/AP lyase activity